MVRTCCYPPALINNYRPDCVAATLASIGVVVTTSAVVASPQRYG